jgi:hypothetical protein
VGRDDWSTRPVRTLGVAGRVAGAVDAVADTLGYTIQDALYEAALLALKAPSIANTQPWHWRLRGPVLELCANRDRQLGLDPDGRLLTVSCGAGLHHARVMLAVQGYLPSVERLPDPASPDVLARLRIAGAHEVRAEDMRRHHSIRVRRSDRRAFRASQPLPAPVLHQVCGAARAEGACADVVAPAELSFLGFATSAAATIEERALAYQEEYADWSVRASQPRPGRHDWSGPGEGDDRFAAYLVISTDTDTPRDWLRAGEATSAALLAATGAGLASSMLSAAVEVPGARLLLRSVTGEARHPQIVLRIGVNEAAEPPPTSRRRSAGEVISIVDA